MKDEPLVPSLLVPHFEPALNVADHKIRRLLDVLPAAAYTCSADGLITYFNSRAAQIWGREPALNDAADRYCGSFKLYTADDAPMRHDRCWMAVTLRENRVCNGSDVVIERPDGSRRHALAYASPFVDGRGQVIGAVNVLVDVTQQKQREAELREADQRKAEFMTIVSRELREPLKPLRQALQRLRETGAGSDGDALQARAELERRVEEMIELVDAFMQVCAAPQALAPVRAEQQVGEG